MAYLLKNLIVSLVILSAGPVFAQSPLTGRAAGNVPQGSIWEEHWLFRKSTLTANSEINMEYYLYGELGNEENMINSLRRNRVQISSASLWGLSATIPEVAVLSLPYLFESPEEADYVYDCCAGDLIRPYLEQIGITFLGWSEAGWTGFYGPQPYLDPAAVQDQTLRTPSTPSVALFFQSLGVDTVFLGIQDVVPALQTGMVEGGASSLPWYLNAFKDHAPHYTLTGHHYETTVLMAAKPWLDAATEAQRAAIDQVFNVFPSQRQTVREDAARKVELLREQGAFVYDLTPQQRARWILAAQAVHPAILRDIGGEAEAIYAQIQMAKAEFKRQHAGTPSTD
ncbi:MAG: TRAP transporter substrate-binding protein DctP [Rhodospirillaceae bacterium]